MDQQFIDAVVALHKMQQVTTVLAKGVGNITTPDGFFKLWNDTEVDASTIIGQTLETLRSERDKLTHWIDLLIKEYPTS